MTPPLKKLFILILIIIIINFYHCYFKKLHISYKDLSIREVLIKNIKRKAQIKRSKNINIKINSLVNICQVKTNIDYNNDFFKLAFVKRDIKRKNISYIETIAGGHGNLGNALIMLNNLINICENIKCRNVIALGKSLNNIIKKPIFYKEKNIIIWPNLYMEKINVDIIINSNKIFHFKYKNKKIYNRLKIIRDEVISNIPKFKNTPDDLVINIRSGDVFINIIHKGYGQPPLCFYQKIINDNKFKNIYLMSNGHENPTVNKLLKIYPDIKYIHGTIKEDASVIIYAYNLVMPISTFPKTLVRLNNNLRKMFVYSLVNFDFKDENFTIYRMEPSLNYLNKIQRKWENTKEQLDLMLNENCSNSNLSILF